MPTKSVIYPDECLARHHPALADLEFKHGNYKALGESETGVALQAVMKSEAVVFSLVAAQIAAPSRPPIVGIHRLLERRFGTMVFTPDFKRLTGRYVRQVLEQLGFSWKRSGVEVVVNNSPYASGSIYAAKRKEQAS